MSMAAWHSERAETTIQSVVLVPVVFLVAFMCFHVGSFFHQKHIAQLAAIRGATVASSMPFSAESASQARVEVANVVDDLNSRLATTPAVSFRDRGVQVTVALKTSTAISFLPNVATAEVWKPLETFRNEQDR
jgi:hypothetical protein